MKNSIPVFLGAKRSTCKYVFTFYPTCFQKQMMFWARCIDSGLLPNSSKRERFFLILSEASHRRQRDDVSQSLNID